MGEYVRLDVDEDTSVGTLRLDRPPVNAMNVQIWHELGDVAREARRDPRIKSMVIWGGPEVFAAGADIAELTTLSFKQIRELAPILQESLAAIADLPFVTVAAIEGYALGGGCELALVADFRFVSESTRIGLPEVTLGILPGAGGTQRLQRLVGVARAKEMILLGDSVSASEALIMGLANRTFPEGSVYEAATDLARKFAGAAYSVRLAKQAIDLGGKLPLDEALKVETAFLSECFATEDCRRGLTTFQKHGPGHAQFEGN